MANLVLPAVTNLFFAIGLFIFIDSVKVTEYSQMYEAAVQRFVETPWSASPPRNIYRVRGPQEVYLWLTNVFATQLFAEKPINGNPHDFCSEAFPCTMGEGNAASDMQCADGLVAGRDGCPSFFDESLSCCEPCVGPDCPLFTVKTMSYEIQNSTSVTDLSKNCEEELQPWLENLAEWNRDVTSSASESFGAALPKFVFCPERVSTVSTDLSTFAKEEIERPLMVARYNRVIMGRVTLKRMKIDKHESLAFGAGYTYQYRESHLFYSTHNPWAENTTDFGDCSACKYTKGGGYRGAGGFVQYLDFDMGEGHLRESFAELKSHGWFDMDQGTLTLDVLLYNGNVNKFLHVSFVFQHGAGGETTALVFASPLDLSFHDESSTQTYVRAAVYFILIVLFIFFLRDEITDMTADPADYLSNFLKIISLSALAMFVVSGVVYVQLVLHHAFITFEFPMADQGFYMERRIQQFDDLVMLSENQEQFFMMLSILWMLVMVRVIVIGTSLIPDMTIVFNTLSRISADLTGLLILVLVFWAGFCFAFHYLFGVRSKPFSGLATTFITTLRMIMGQTLYEAMEQGDPSYSSIFFIMFHVWFLILQQVLLSVVIVGFDDEKQASKSPGDTLDKHPVFKIFTSMKDFVKGHLSFVTRLLSILDQLFGLSDGGTGRINADEIGKLRDRRTTKPRIRQVRYEPKHEIRIEDDVHLVPQKPAYPDGLMHYYVDYPTYDGQAWSHSVKTRFRLIAFKGAEPDFDYEEFRKPEVFEKKYKSNTKEMLKQIGHDLHTENSFGALTSIDLMFEGDPKTVTFNCVTFMGFWLVFVFWANMVSRVDSSFELAKVMVTAIQNPTWVEYNAERVVSFSSVSKMTSVFPWMENALLQSEYECYGSTSRPSELCAFLTENLVRQDWSLYAESMDTTSPLYYKYPYGVTVGVSQESAAGFSMAYTPRRDMEVTKAVRVAGYNIGVHPNSHARMTIQIPCFVDNHLERWSQGYPFILDEGSLGKNCLHDSCMKDSIAAAKASGQCKNRLGKVRKNFMEIDGDWSKVTYFYSEKGSYRGLGGIVVGLGGTATEADIILHALEEDNLFSEAIGIAIETVTYNGNYEMFTYTAVKFAVLDTGLLKKDIYTAVYPVKIFAAGQREGYTDAAFRSWTFALFVLVVVYLLYFFYHVLVDVYVQYRISSKMYHHWYQMPLDFFTEDAYNIVELTSLCFSVAVMAELFIYQAYKPTFDIENVPWFVKSWTTANYKLDGKVGPMLPADDFDNHRFVGESWRLLVGLMGVTAMSLGVNALKYMNFIHSLRLSVLTFASASAELISMAIIIFLMLFGFMVMFSLRFGVQIARFGTMGGSLKQLFIWICNEYTVDDLLTSGFVYFGVLFPIFSVLFFVLSNMFLAAVVFAWKATRREARDPSVINELKRIYDVLFPKRAEDEDDVAKQPTKMDLEYWRATGILTLLPKLREDGMIDIPHHGNEGAGSARSRGTGGTPRPGDMDDPMRIAAVFKRVHMEIASQLCRNVRLEEEFDDESDHGGGVGLDTRHHVVEEFYAQDGTMRAMDPGDPTGMLAGGEIPAQHHHTVLPILDHEVDDKTKSEVAGILVKYLNRDRNMDAQEFLLDALITALEKTETLKAVQEFFLMPPILYPRKPQEKKKFEEMKTTMEQQLNYIVRWLEVEAKIKHFSLLKEQTLARERVLKQQSLVLADYLAGIEEQIEMLTKEIEELNTKTVNLRKHMTPLL